MIKKHRTIEFTEQIIQETIRESRQNWDGSEKLLQKIKRTISQLEQNLCLNCNKEPSEDCEICNGHFYININNEFKTN